MPKTTFKIKTWSCAQCSYRQDYEPTEENHAIHFKDYYLKDNCCPACHMGKNPKKEVVLDNTHMQLVTDPAKKDEIIIMGEDDIEDEIADLNKKRVKNEQAEMTEQEKKEHRTQRKQDIKDAIGKAKLLAD